MKKIDISTVLNDFEGKAIKDNDKEVTLKSILLFYISQGNSLNLNAVESATAYEVGVLIGGSQGEVLFSQQHYDLLKKLADNPKTSQGPLAALLITQQVKRLIDGAENVNEPQ